MNVTDVTDVTHIYRRDMFTEKLEHFGRNRQLAERSYVKPATLANGSDGVVIHHGRTPIVLSADEAEGLIAAVRGVLDE